MSKPELKMTPTDVKGGQRYRHTKTGKEYLIICVAKHSETEEDVVVYKPIYPSDIPFWVRPLAMFTDEKVVDGKTVKRFTLVK